MTIVQKIVRADSLPAEWRKEFPAPDTLVRVLMQDVQSGDTKADDRAEIARIMDQAAAQAEARGLTPQRLRELLDTR